MSNLVLCLFKCLISFYSVKLKVNKMTSSQTLLPVEYYKLPFCQPPEGAKMDNENLGEFLAGDRIESSPYVLSMKKEVYCQQVCITDFIEDQYTRENVIVLTSKSMPSGSSQFLS